jgi:sugar/nucleoside kinase (ribokinase family)
VICVLGDAHLDVVVSASGALAVDTDTPARVRLCVGGQGANVAAWVVALGGRSRLIAALADDPAGTLVAGELASRGIEFVGPVAAGHTGVVVALSDAGARRSMLTDRGVGPSLTAGAIDPEWLRGCSWLHLSGYSLVAEPAMQAAMAAASAARASSVRLSVDLSSAAAIEAFGAARFQELITGLRPDLVFADRAEFEIVGELTGIEVIRKLGADGVLVGGRHYPAVATTPVDATGAGDAFAAGYLVGGVALGLAAAARAVATMGAMP